MADKTIKIIIYRQDDPARAEIDRLKLSADGVYAIGRGTDAQIRLDDPTVSRRHAQLELASGKMAISDLGSTNGTFLDGRQIDSAAWEIHEELVIGAFLLVRAEAAEAHAGRVKETAYTAIVRDDAPAQAQAARTQFPGAAFDRPQVSAVEIIADKRFAGECTYLALGAGLGSFCWVDHLRVYGVPAQEIRAIGLMDKPYSKYERLCHNSQIPRHERLRSNSLSTPDNIWGFPGYASREAFGNLFKEGPKAFRHIFQVFGEPALAVSYTPQAGQVFTSLDKEAARIGWDEMFVPGHVLAIRKTDDERYVVAYRVPADRARAGERDRFMIARYLHLATGYPASQYLPDLQDFRHRHPGLQRVINAYEQHDAIYDGLIRDGGTVVIRGRGIVATRVIQRLYEARRKNSDIRVVHLMRSRIGRDKAHKYGPARRFVANDVELQPFNWPKACWGGTLRAVLENADADTRAGLIATWGGTTTAERPDWDQMILDGKREGWYEPVFGNVIKLRHKDGVVSTEIEETDRSRKKLEVVADYVIDCTGLIGDIDRSRLLKDLIETYELPRNKAGAPGGRQKPAGLQVTNAFEVQGLRNGAGRAFAAGVLTSGGPYAAVDSFLGLQYAALRAVDALYVARAPGITGFGPIRSMSQWFKWCAGSAP